MKKNLHFYVVHYIVLFTILSVCGWFFFQFEGLREKQTVIVVVSAAFYIVWGAWHHVLKGDFHRRIMIEYVLVGLLAILLFRGIMYR